MNSLRSHWKICLLGLLLLMCGASEGMPWSMDSGINWQHCESASRQIVEQLSKLGVIPLALKRNESDFFPKKIECEDHCDPESLGNNKMHCLQKIIQGLRHYYKLLGMYSYPQQITDLKSALSKLFFLLQKDPDFNRTSPDTCNQSKQVSIGWKCEPLQKHTLWRLQSFSVMVARVFTHSAALSGNAEIQQ